MKKRIREGVEEWAPSWEKKRFYKQMNEVFEKAANAVMENKTKSLPGYKSVAGTQTKWGEIIDVVDVNGFLTVCTMPNLGGPYWFFVFTSPETIAETAAVPKSGNLDILKKICRNGGFHLFCEEGGGIKYSDYKFTVQPPDTMIR